jgi:hypothetical protein
MSPPDRPIGATDRIARRAIALAALIALPILSLVWWDQGRTNRELAEMKRLIRQLARMPAASPDVDRAISLGRDAIRKGQWDLGQIYLVNAITNSPGDIGRLREYATIVLEQEDPPMEAIDRLSSMLQLAAYQADAEEVPSALALIDRAERARKRILEASPGAPQAGGSDPRREWVRLSRTAPDLWKDAARLAAHLQEVEDFLSRLDEQGNPPAEIRSRAAAELLRWTEVAQALKQCGYIDNCLVRLRNGEDLASQRAVAIVQAAENALPTFWGLNAASLPEDIAKKIGDYPAAIQDLVGRIGQARSVRVLGQIREALAGGTEESRPWQEKCERIERQVQSAQRLVVQLTSPEAMQETQGLIEEKSKALRKYRNNQFYEYQAWAIDRCDGAFRAYMEYKFGLSEDDARKIFRDHKLAEIDQALLSPEVSRVFNDVLGKLMAEMGAPALVTTEKDMGTTTKVGLEHF